MSDPFTELHDAGAALFEAVVRALRIDRLCEWLAARLGP